MGYSPERINPGDTEHTLSKVKKVVSASSPDALKKVAGIYNSIVTAGTWPVSSIEVAEATKLVENIQRDVNIALINELSLALETLDIDVQAVIDAASTKWNFHRYKPGLVGGHCIPEDPYYLIHKLGLSDFVPELIIKAREVNERFPKATSARIKRELESRNIRVNRVLLVGFSFKKDSADLRNTGAQGLYDDLNEWCQIDVLDPLIDESQFEALTVSSVQEPEKGAYEVVIVNVLHSEIADRGINFLKELLTDQGQIIDLFNSLNPAA